MCLLIVYLNQLNHNIHQRAKHIPRVMVFCPNNERVDNVKIMSHYIDLGCRLLILLALVIKDH